MSEATRAYLRTQTDAACDKLNRVVAYPARPDTLAQATFQVASQLAWAVGVGEVGGSPVTISPRSQRQYAEATSRRANELAQIIDCREGIAKEVERLVVQVTDDMRGEYVGTAGATSPDDLSTWGAHNARLLLPWLSVLFKDNLKKMSPEHCRLVAEVRRLQSAATLMTEEYFEEAQEHAEGDADTGTAVAATAASGTTEAVPALEWMDCE
ncbi:hypothetical protein FA95DRAFT_1613124 [Auriscalpium vulgare]|uniref:Uncharacterized protein n=1 Tax=Auriscalpium vulgare TaxID=40419 RepID=A0ACB8R3Q7_9AGAM|nr:hypothetical protein FA95DRAFT_1613124 [Auriscalpium vulgare]